MRIWVNIIVRPEYYTEYFITIIISEDITNEDISSEDDLKCHSFKNYNKISKIKWISNKVFKWRGSDKC